jgi:hypothetical protein
VPVLLSAYISGAYLEHQQAQDVLMHQAAVLQGDSMAAAAAGGVNGLLIHHTASGAGPDLMAYAGATTGTGGAAAAAGGSGAVGGMGTWPQQQQQPSQSQSSSVGLDTSNVEQAANTHQLDQRQASIRSSGANTGSNAGGNRKGQ